MIRFRLAGVDISVSFFFLAFCALTAALSRHGSAACSLVFMLWHELGHLTANCLVGGRLRWLRLLPGGFEMGTDGRLTAARRAAVLLAGPLFNGLAAVLLAAVGASAQLRAVNAALLALNLLPVGHLDGGQLLELLLDRLLPPERCEQVCRLASLFFGLLLAGGAVALFARAGAVPPAVFSVYVLLCVLSQTAENS